MDNSKNVQPKLTDEQRLAILSEMKDLRKTSSRYKRLRDILYPKCDNPENEFRKKQNERHVRYRDKPLAKISEIKKEIKAMSKPVEREYEVRCNGIIV